MTALAQSQNTIRKPAHLFVIGGLGLLALSAIAIPNLCRSRIAADRASDSYRQSYSATLTHQTGSAEVATSGSTGVEQILRTSSMAVIVLHPPEVTQRITALAEALGGYLVILESGSENAAILTIRVPANRFEEARTRIRKLGLRVQTERVEAQDVSRQYVDQDATIRNLGAEEAGYLFILKQATTVKDMLAVSQKLSEVRRQIEQQQPEFNVLSKQVETVAISISLQTEAELVPAESGQDGVARRTRKYRELRGDHDDNHFLSSCHTALGRNSLVLCTWVLALGGMGWSALVPMET